MVLALAESVRIQSLTLTLQTHRSRRRMTVGRVAEPLARELSVGVLLGIAYAAAIFWKTDPCIAAGPIVLTLTDLASLVTYLTLAARRL